MAYAVLALVVVGLIVLAGLSRRSTLSDAILGFAHSMDKTSFYARSRSAARPRSSGL